MEPPGSGSEVGLETSSPGELADLASSHLTRHILFHTELNLSANKLDGLVRLLHQLANDQASYLHQFLGDCQSCERATDGPVIWLLTQLLRLYTEPADDVGLCLLVLESLCTADNVDQIVRCQTVGVVLGSMAALSDVKEVQLSSSTILSRLAQSLPQPDKKALIREAGVEILLQTLANFPDEVDIVQPSLSSIVGGSWTLYEVMKDPERPDDMQRLHTKALDFVCRSCREMVLQLKEKYLENSCVQRDCDQFEELLAILKRDDQNKACDYTAEFINLDSEKVACYNAEHDRQDGQPDNVDEAIVTQAGNGTHDNLEFDQQFISLNKVVDSMEAIVKHSSDSNIVETATDKQMRAGVSESSNGDHAAADSDYLHYEQTIEQVVSPVSGSANHASRANEGENILAREPADVAANYSEPIHESSNIESTHLDHVLNEGSSFKDAPLEVTVVTTDAAAERLHSDSVANESSVVDCARKEVSDQMPLDLAVDNSSTERNSQSDKGVEEYLDSITIQKDDARNLNSEMVESSSDNTVVASRQACPSDASTQPTDHRSVIEDPDLDRTAMEGSGLVLTLTSLTIPSNLTEKTEATEAFDEPEPAKDHGVTNIVKDTEGAIFTVIVTDEDVVKESIDVTSGYVVENSDIFAVDANEVDAVDTVVNIETNAPTIAGETAAVANDTAADTVVATTEVSEKLNSSSVDFMDIGSGQHKHHSPRLILDPFIDAPGNDGRNSNQSSDNFSALEANPEAPTCSNNRDNEDNVTAVKPKTADNVLVSDTTMEAATNEGNPNRSPDFMNGDQELNLDDFRRGMVVVHEKPVDLPLGPGDEIPSPQAASTPDDLAQDSLDEDSPPNSTHNKGRIPPSHLSLPPHESAETRSESSSSSLDLACTRLQLRRTTYCVTSPTNATAPNVQTPSTDSSLASSVGCCQSHELNVLSDIDDDSLEKSPGDSFQDCASLDEDSYSLSDCCSETHDVTTVRDVITSVPARSASCPGLDQYYDSFYDDDLVDELGDELEDEFADEDIPDHGTRRARRGWGSIHPPDVEGLLSQRTPSMIADTVEDAHRVRRLHMPPSQSEPDIVSSLERKSWDPMPLNELLYLEEKSLESRSEMSSGTSQCSEADEEGIIDYLLSQPHGYIVQLLVCRTQVLLYVLGYWNRKRYLTVFDILGRPVMRVLEDVRLPTEIADFARSRQTETVHTAFVSVLDRMTHIDCMTNKMKQKMLAASEKLLVQPLTPSLTVNVCACTEAIYRKWKQPDRKSVQSLMATITKLQKDDDLDESIISHLNHLLAVLEQNCEK